MLTYSKESVTGVTSTAWTVKTDKSLSFSNLFLFNLFYDGETSPVAVSETFNITGVSSSSTTTSSATSSSTTSISTTSSFTTSTSATSPTGSATSAAAAATTGAISDQRGGLSTGAKVGIGIGTAAVALGGIAVGYFLFRHRAKKQQYVGPPHAAGHLSPVPMEQKPAHQSAGPIYEPPTYELHGLSGPTMMHELSGDATRH